MTDNDPSVHGKNSNKMIWVVYNEWLVRRMKDIFALKDIENYRFDLMKQNRKKNGLCTLIHYFSLLKVQNQN